MVPANATNVTGSGVIHAGPCVYRGFWISSGGAQTVTIYDHASAASGTVLAQFAAAAAGESFDENVMVACANGIYVSVSAGSVAGSIRYG